MIKKIIKRVSGFYLFHKYPITKEFTKFCMVGLTNLVVDMVFYLLFTRFFHLYYIFAAIISFVFAVSWSFFINRRWTFRHQEKDLFTQYIKFVIANLVGLLINLLLLWIFVDFIGLHDLAAKLIVTVIVSFVNFMLNKLWTFRKSVDLTSRDVI